MFNHDEGYVTPKDVNDYSAGFDYVYNYVDHLGNIRLSYTDADGNGSIDPANEMVEENNYYPFGMKHKGYNGNISSLGNSVAKKFKFQGQELDESLGYNMYEFELRHYDASIGRFMTTDPYEQFDSPYVAMGNNPVVSFDPDGGLCYDANGNAVACPDGEEYDEFRDSKKSHITVLDEVVLTPADSNTEEEEFVDDGLRKITPSKFPSIQELAGLDHTIAEIELNLTGERTVETGLGDVKVDAAGNLVRGPVQAGLGAVGLLGGLGSGSNLMKFKGLVQNLRLRTLTHHQLVKAFKGTGLKLSGHAITRLKHPRLQSLGVNTLNDFKQIINKGSQFKAAGGAVGYSHKGVEVIINPQTKVIITVRPAKNIR